MKSGRNASLGGFYMRVDSNKRAIRLFIACPGIGHINRGFETFAFELAGALHKDPLFEAVLLTGAHSESSNGTYLPCLKRTGWLSRRIGGCIGRDAYFVEQATFALAMVPNLLSKRPEIILTSDGALCNILDRIRRALRLKFRIVLSNGGPYSMPYPASDHVHQVLRSEADKALVAGHPAERQSLIPYGFNIDRSWFPPTAQEQTQQRQRLGLPLNRRVVVSVGAINRSHKRMDYLVSEVAQLSPCDRPFVVILGQADDETAAVLKMATEKLGVDGYLACQVPSSEVPHYLRAADAFVLCSLAEGFGRVIVEALADGVPCILHNAPFAREVAGDFATLVDQSQAGGLADALRCLFAAEVLNGDAQARHDYAYREFSWESLATRYAELITHCACEST